MLESQRDSTRKKVGHTAEATNVPSLLKSYGVEWRCHSVEERVLSIREALEFLFQHQKKIKNRTTPAMCLALSSWATNKPAFTELSLPKGQKVNKALPLCVAEGHADRMPASPRRRCWGTDKDERT